MGILKGTVTWLPTGLPEERGGGDGVCAQEGRGERERGGRLSINVLVIFLLSI